MKILIAEDQPLSALYLRRTLEKMGHEAVAVPDGEQAWQFVRDGYARVLISDWMMPHLDGPELCRRIRASRNDHYTYIILLTSRDCRRDRLKGLRAGADDFLIKPPDADELAVRLEIAERILVVHEQLAQQNARLAELAAIDDLTGTKNRRRFREDLDLLVAQAIRMGTPLSLVILDIDHFKIYNDTHGHPAGDALLKWVGMTLRSAVRSHDVVARYGGEEFVVLLPATNANEAVEVAERLRLAVSLGPPSEFAVTASFGVATLGPATPTPSALVEHADQALYRSKHAGRDQITHYQEGSPRESTPSALNTA
jgi:diguanylate cyclase (GGDEF)-like protein